MFLLIDTSEKDEIHLAIFDENFIEHKSYPGQNRELLSCIHDLLGGTGNGERGIEEKVGGIMVVVGAGSFTSTRVACVVANTFGYVLQIPLLAISKEQAKDPQKLISKLLKQPKACPPKSARGGRRWGQYISATYSGEANIGGQG